MPMKKCLFHYFKVSFIISDLKRFSLEIVAAVESGSGLRPRLQDIEVSDTLAACMESCWAEDSDTRPDFRFIRVKLKEMQAGL